MPSDGNRSQSELDRTLEQLVVRQTATEKDVERLETLEFTHWDDGRGCVSFEDFDFVNAVAAARVDVNPDQAENGDWKATQALLYWTGNHDGALGAIVNLHMRINNHVGANYYSSYKYSKGAAITPVGLDAQTSYFVGRLTDSSSVGWITVPFYPANWNFHSVFGDWTGFDSQGALNAKQEKGEFGGYAPSGPLNINRFDFFPSAGNFEHFRVMLYLRCPQLSPTLLPDD